MTNQTKLNSIYIRIFCLYVAKKCYLFSKFCLFINLCKINRFPCILQKYISSANYRQMKSLQKGKLKRRFNYLEVYKKAENVILKKHT